MAMERFTKQRLDAFLALHLLCNKTEYRLDNYEVWQRPNGECFLVPIKSEEKDGKFPDYLLDDMLQTVGPTPMEVIAAAKKKETKAS